MGTINVGQENSTAIELYYEDHGSGPPVVLLSGWPLDSRSWEPQLHALLAAGNRVITYDRRGFGQSSRPTEGYNFDTLAADLDRLLTELDLREVTLVGFSLGTGELARYIGTYGTDRLRACVFIESLAPSFVKSDENPNGVDQAGVDAVQQAILVDRPAWLSGRSETSSTSTTTSASASARRRCATTGTPARGVSICDVGLRRHVARGLPRGHQADRHPDADPARHGRPHPVDRGSGTSAARCATRGEVCGDRGRPARHVRHACARGQP